MLEPNSVHPLYSSPLDVAPGTEDSSWFAIHVRSRCESKTYQELGLRGFESFLPLRLVRHRWSDRFKTFEEPIFPGYLFCRFDLSARFRVLNTPGVAQIIGAGTTPIPVAEDEIRSIRTLAASRLALTPWPCLRTGLTVRIAWGPLAGVQGIVVRAEDGSHRVVVSVNLLNRGVSVEVERDWIELAQS
jgi:transcription antitermination factor NusG